MSDLTIPIFVVKEDEVAIQTFYQNGKNYIHFIFKDKFTYDSSVTATEAWKEYCDKSPGKNFVHIWDCQNMQGFDKKAKDLWMEYMDSYIGQTEKIILVSDNILIRGAARIMSKFTKHNLSIYKTFSEMKEAEL
ncbi:hypothetical protein [Ekhidna sp.]